MTWGWDLESVPICLASKLWEGDGTLDHQERFTVG